MPHEAPLSAPTLHVETVAGAGSRTALLLHGGGVGGWMWQPLARHLGGEWTLLIPDLPGHDRSAAEPYRSHAHTLAALVALIEERAEGPITVVGFSLGAQLAVLLAATRPDLVERVAVISAQAQPSRMPGLTLALLGAFAPLASNERFARAQARELFVPDELLPAYLRASQAMSKDTLLASVGENVRFTIPPGWSEFPGPALVLVGGRERRLMLQSAELLARALPQSTLETVAECGHGIPLQRPEWLAERLRSWA